MNQKVTKEQFLQIIENNEEGKKDYELAKELGITHQQFSNLRRKHSAEIVAMAREITRRRAERYLHDLERQSKKEKETGKTAATKILLEMAGAYTPKQQTEFGISKRLEAMLTKKRIEAEDRAKLVGCGDE